MIHLPKPKGITQNEKKESQNDSGQTRSALEARGITGLPYIQERHDFGRYYHKRINLQSMPKVVRHAALGKCYEYDLNSAVFSVKLLLTSQLFQDIGGDFGSHHWHSKELLLEKKQVIKRLSSLLSVPQPEKLIKKLLTALSFDAQLSDRLWKEGGRTKFGSFTDIIKRPDDRKALLDDGWLVIFAKEQKQQTNFLVNQLKDVVRTWVDEEKLKTPKGRWKKNRVMSLVYQRLETNLMKRIIEEFSDKVILHVHDAVYTSKPLSREKLEGVVEEFLFDVGVSPKETFIDLRFSRTDHKAYSKNPYVPKCELEKQVEAFDRRAGAAATVPKSDDDELTISIMKALNPTLFGPASGLGTRFHF